ncbi:hypothetical protein CD351_00795 [Erythrobacter sp. KY5]|uniref:CPBP family intramembrane glutamic endopeptidase n=1 Tax=Erythrobacter sp. KY5 TaxID=2011159 RepID=UPI000DBEFB29|nr:CPBP family intramembrane glutamic endopeptidase [Erythrobacter sp. KY5]AWW72957.1 hypothetical protein CD351_00795 [Erythrobacter sp. KY5]
MTDMPTSPRSTAEIDAVFGDGPLSAAPAASLVGEWRRAGAFLKRPSLGVGAQDGAPLKVLARIYALDMAAMAVLITMASIAVAAGVYIPETALAGIEFTPLVIASVVIGAPVLEEIFFRGWLSGKPAHIFALLAIILGAVAFGFAHQSAPMLGLAAPVIGIAAAIGLAYWLRDRPPFGWFAFAFPAFFWLSTIAFALVHLWNFEEGSLAILLPLVLPQFILGALLGYMRVRIGLWAAIALHAAHNATALSVAALAMGAGG